MPFQSEKQRRYMHANLPDIAKRWERDYAGGGRIGFDLGTNYKTRKELIEESGLEIDEIEDEDDGSGSLDDTESSITNELVIILTNQAGEEKKLIIKYNEE